MYNIKILKTSHISMIYIYELSGTLFKIISISKDINLDTIFNMKSNFYDWVKFNGSLDTNKLNNIITLLESQDNTIIKIKLTNINNTIFFIKNICIQIH